MKKFRNYRLVCAGLNFLGGAFRLIAALVDMVLNYLLHWPCFGNGIISLSFARGGGSLNRLRNAVLSAIM